MANPPKPIERKRLLEKGDGQGSRHGEKKKEIMLIPTDKPAVYDPDFIPLPTGMYGRGLDEWHKIWTSGWPWLHPAEDYHWVEQISRAYNDLEDFRLAIQRQGLTMKGYAGQVVANPLIKESRACEATIRKCLSQLGFSPTDRARLGLAEIKRQSGIAELQSKTRDNSKR